MGGNRQPTSITLVCIFKSWEKHIAIARLQKGKAVREDGMLWYNALQCRGRRRDEHEGKKKKKKGGQPPHFALFFSDQGPRAQRQVFCALFFIAYSCYGTIVAFLYWALYCNTAV